MTMTRRELLASGPGTAMAWAAAGPSAARCATVATSPNRTVHITRVHTVEVRDVPRQPDVPDAEDDDGTPVRSEEVE